MRARRLCVVAVLLAAGCGAESTERGDDVLSRAIERTEEQRTVRGLSVTDWVDDGKPLQTACTQELDVAADRARIACSGVTIGAVDGLRQDVLVVGDRTYMRLESMKWTVLPRLPETESGALGPGGLLEAARDAAMRVERLGSEAVRGLETRRYRVHIRQDTEDFEGSLWVDVWIDGENLLRRMRFEEA
jgi:hypothetical protein